eukprot:snap_masked-scaffold_38-processed-gene-1.41-mRNA-1 protein AED:1.00 eAED:1.00 QI:0/0/0/0/1/1/3/0/92
MSATTINLHVSKAILHFLVHTHLSLCNTSKLYVFENCMFLDIYSRKSDMQKICLIVVNIGSGYYFAINDLKHSNHDRSWDHISFTESKYLFR